MDEIIYKTWILWGLRLGAILLIISFLVPKKGRRTFLKKAIRRQNNVISGRRKRNRWVEYLDVLTEKPIFRFFMLEEDSDDYVALEKRILQAGGLSGADPNVIQLFRIMLPSISFVLFLLVYTVRIAVGTVSITDNSAKVLDLQNGLGQGGYLSFNNGPVQFSWVHVVIIAVLAGLTYFLPSLLMWSKARARAKRIESELPVIQSLVLIMLETGTHTVYDILRMLLNITVFFQPCISMCVNEYYTGPEKAIQNMAERVADDKFQIICNSLKQAVQEDKRFTADFLRQYLEQLREMERLAREKRIKQKPMAFVFLLAMPLFGIVAIWLYPWVVKVLNMLNTFI